MKDQIEKALHKARREGNRKLVAKLRRQLRKVSE